MTQATRPEISTEAPRTLLVAMELSKDTWKLGFSTGGSQRVRIRDVRARDLAGFLDEVRLAKEFLGLEGQTHVLCCYEAGRDGFWIHRFLEGNGIANLVVDPASIEVDRRKRRAKTDRIDVQKLVRLLARHEREGDVLRVVRVPPAQAEDERLLPRQLRRFKCTRVRVGNQIRAALFQHGIDLDPGAGSFVKQEFLKRLSVARQWDGAALPAELVTSVRMLWDQYALVTRQIKDLEQRQRQMLRQARSEGNESPAAHRKAATLTSLRGIGDTGAMILVSELFGWREFSSRKELGALAGLVGTPHQSGSKGREQGISKAGKPTSALPDGGVGVAVAAMAAEQPHDALVPRPRRQGGKPGQAQGHRRRRTQAPGRAVALRGARRGARGSCAEAEHGQERGLKDLEQ